MFFIMNNLFPFQIKTKRLKITSKIGGGVSGVGGVGLAIGGAGGVWWCWWYLGIFESNETFKSKKK